MPQAAAHKQVSGEHITTGIKTPQNKMLFRSNSQKRRKVNPQSYNYFTYSKRQVKYPDIQMAVELILPVL